MSHIFIPRRDRLTRPDDPLDGIRLENDLRKAGISLVFLDRILPPLSSNQRPDLGEAIAAYVDYDQSGKFCEDLAEKILLAQLQLAQMGLATGGRPPFGFSRFLIAPDGTIVRELNDGEVVQQGAIMWFGFPAPNPN